MRPGDHNYLHRLAVLRPDATPAELAQEPCPHRSGLPIAKAGCCMGLRHFLRTGRLAAPVTDADLDDVARLRRPGFGPDDLLDALEDR